MRCQGISGLRNVRKGPALVDALLDLGCGDSRLDHESGENRLESGLGDIPEVDPLIQLVVNVPERRGLFFVYTHFKDRGVEGVLVDGHLRVRDIGEPDGWVGRDLVLDLPVPATTDRTLFVSKHDHGVRRASGSCRWKLVQLESG